MSVALPRVISTDEPPPTPEVAEVQPLSTDPPVGITQAAGPGGFVFPVGGRCAFVDTFGAPRAGGRTHEGVDIIAAQGKPVYAVTSGTIWKLAYDRPGSLGGNNLHLRAGDGSSTYYYYAHFVAFADGIAKGSVVSAGQVIGYIGETGNASAPHLHFEIHPNGGGAINPYPPVKAVDACRTEVTSPVWNGVAPTPPPASTTPSTIAPASTVPGNAGSTPAAPALVAGGFVPTRPTRLVDSRIALGLPGLIGAGAATTIQAAGVAGVPADASWIHANVVSVGATADGAVTIVPCGGAPESSVLHVPAAGITGTAAVIPLTNGTFCVSSSVSTHLVVDVMGYGSPANGAGLVQLSPARVYDSRLPGGTRMVARSVRGVKVVGFPGIPGDALAATINVTVVDPRDAGFVTAWPCGGGSNETSVLNFARGETRGNSFTIGVGTNGSVCFSSNTSASLVVDVSAVWMGSTGSTLQAMTPRQVVDTATSGTTLRAQQVTAVPIAGVNGVPAGTDAVVVAVTARGAAVPGYVTLWPCDRPRPATSAVNFLARAARSNMSIQALAADGTLCAFANTGVDLVIDVEAIAG